MQEALQTFGLLMGEILAAAQRFLSEDDGFRKARFLVEIPYQPAPTPLCGDVRNSRLDLRREVHFRPFGVAARAVR
jgi:hypothetical protein